MNHLFKQTIVSPIGFIEVISDQTSVLTLSFIKQKNNSSLNQPLILKKAVRQLNEYFNEERMGFELELNPSGTEFQKRVWQEVEKVPFGEPVSYLDIAIQTGSKNNTRAVGLANGKNPIPIIIPCHRVIGSNGKLIGYAGGFERKKWLLQHELKHSLNSKLLF